MDIAPIIALVIINKKMLDFVRELWPDNGVKNKYVQLCSWGIGVALAFLFANSTYGNGIDVWEGQNLGSLDPLAVAIFGLLLGSGAGITHDAIARRNPQPDS